MAATDAGNGRNRGNDSNPTLDDGQRERPPTHNTQEQQHQEQTGQEPRHRAVRMSGDVWEAR
jgi:hypothetical protein